jgi:outer membrane scaffolding protein for murein synthesis (MipA/OmpV family)
MNKLNAQENGKWSQISKAGYAFTGDGDIHFGQLELGANYSFHSRLSAEATVGLGRSFDGVYSPAAFTKINANAFYQLTNPEKRYSLGIGAGYSYMNLNFNNSFFPVDDVYPTQFTSVATSGFNVVLRNKWKVYKQFHLGLDINYQNYADYGPFIGGQMVAQIKI